MTPQHPLQGNDLNELFAAAQALIQEEAQQYLAEAETRRQELDEKLTRLLQGQGTHPQVNTEDVMRTLQDINLRILLAKKRIQLG